MSSFGAGTSNERMPDFSETKTHTVTSGINYNGDILQLEHSTVAARQKLVALWMRFRDSRPPCLRGTDPRDVRNRTSLLSPFPDGTCCFIGRINGATFPNRLCLSTYAGTVPRANDSSQQPLRRHRMLQMRTLSCVPINCSLRVARRHDDTISAGATNSAAHTRRRISSASSSIERETNGLLINQ
jgi:hypothetical protein